MNICLTGGSVHIHQHSLRNIIVKQFNTIFCWIMRTFGDYIYFHFGYFLVGNLGKPAGSHFVFGKRLRVLLTA